MKSLTPKNARWYSVFGLPVLMCVEYISALKVATSYKFLFIAFLSIKYSALVCFFVRYATFIPVFANIIIYQCVTLDCEIETGRRNGA
ncbi:hypothetical protein LNO11_11995 [Klebsiella pneumoniae subsp. pneumoniae]|nr:hypothetical protein [Klebsiella pneumoniae subsp. pneumoniae]